MEGLLDMKNWEESATRAMGHCWMTDCDCLYQHLMSHRLNTFEIERVAIGLMASRQQIWERGGENIASGSRLRCLFPLDTSVMLADPLTKAMTCERLANLQAAASAAPAALMNRRRR